MIENLLNITEASRALKISPHTLRSWIFQKKVPIVRLGRRILFREKDLEKMIEDGIQESKVDGFGF
jgi:excisionase family DNA binding protein